LRIAPDVGHSRLFVIVAQASMSGRENPRHSRNATRANGHMSRPSTGLVMVKKPNG